MEQNTTTEIEYKTVHSPSQSAM